MKEFYEHFLDSQFILPISNINPMDGWKSLEVSENSEPLVALGAFSSYPEILTDSIYYGEASSSPYKMGELDGALITCFIRETLANMLSQASKLLPRGYAFIVWDGYRPLSVQNALHSDFVKQLMDVRGMSLEEANAFAPNYVSVASADPKKPSPHFTGGSVDLGVIKYDDSVLDMLEKCTINVKSSDWKIAYDAEMLRQKLKRENSVIVDVGAQFDEAKENAAVLFFERKIADGQKLTESDYNAAMNRRVFQNILRSVGFTSFEHEWWHFDFGNQFSAKQSGKNAVYGPIELSQSNREHEIMRANHFEGTNVLARTAAPLLSNVSEVLAAAIGGAKHGDMTSSKLPRALRLEA